MENRYTKYTSTVVAAFAVALLLLPTDFASAQFRPPLTQMERERLRQQRNIRSHRRWVNTIPLFTEQQMRMAQAAQARKDSERIQFFNAEMMRSVSQGAPPDYDGIVKATGEIKKRAARLMGYLKLSRMDESERTQIAPEYLDSQQLADSLKRLDLLVRRFGANSLSQPRSASVIDAKAAIDARQDLEEIIVLSDKIKKSAKRLRQAARPEQH